jgi:hypothetical protein
MLHTQNQLPRLPRTALIVIIPAVVVCCVGVIFLTDTNTTPTKIVLSRFGLLVWGSGLKCNHIGVVWWCGFFTDNNTTLGLN